MTLQETNKLNFEILTVSDLKFLYHRHGFMAVCHDGRIVEFLADEVSQCRKTS